MPAKAGVSNPNSAGGGDKFVNAGVFINAYHSKLFRFCFPVSHALITKTPGAVAQAGRPHAQVGDLKREVDVLKGYRFTWKTLTALGMANRLESAARH